MRFRQTYFPLLPATFLSAVVAYELYVNARDRPTRNLLQELVGLMERAASTTPKRPVLHPWSLILLARCAVVLLVGRLLEPGDAASEADGYLHEVLVPGGAVPVLHPGRGVVTLTDAHLP